MRKLLIVSGAAFLLILIATLLVTGCFGSFNFNPPSPTRTATPSTAPTPTPTDTRPTIIVPDDYPTISAAIANATDGDLIIVKNGTYNEQVLNINKTLTIQSEYQGCAKIVLHPPLREIRSQWDTIGPRYEPAVRISSDNVVLSGFSIRGCEGEGMFVVEKCDGSQILDNSLPNVYVIFHGDNGKILGNSIEGLTFDGSNNTIRDNRIFGDLNVMRGSNNVIEDNDVSGEITRYDLK